MREALKLFAGVADALEYAHQESIIHRDIKPSNLILASDGRLMVADFGLAKIGGAQSITRTGDFMGSPGYMSPEQAMARRIPIDHRTDVWSMGVTLYEFLTLQHPFQGSTIELTLRNIITHEPRPPRQLNPRLPKDVETILLKSLEKNPDHRYASAGALAADLHCVLNYESIQARSQGAITRSVRYVRRNVAKVAVGALSVALLFVGVWAFTELRNRERREVERYFESVRNHLGERENPLLDDGTITSIQDALRGSSSKMEELSAAIDQLGMKTADEVKHELEDPNRARSLETAMRSLAKVQAIYFHNPNHIERDRLETIDRATVDQRIQIIQRIADRLTSQAQGGAVLQPGETERLWDWLCMFLGTRPMIAGTEEKNPLVRVNAMHAMGALAGHRPRFLAELQHVLSEPSLDPLVVNEAVAALTSLPGSSENKEVLDTLASMMKGDRRTSLPVQVRYRIAQAFQTSPLRKQYREPLLVLKEDEVFGIQRLAKEALE